MKVVKRFAILGTRGIPAAYGGFETFAEELAVRLVAKGVDVTVYCEKKGEGQPHQYKGVILKYIPPYSCGPLTTILFDLLCLLDARGKYDVVYMLGYGAAPFCIIPRLFGKKVWLNVDGIEWARAKWNSLARFYFKAMEFCSTWVPNKIIADAAGIKEHLVSRHRLFAPCDVIPYGAPIIEIAPNSDFLGEFNLKPQGYFLVVARLEPENHVREIVEGYLQAKTDTPLVIVGNIQSETQYIKEVVKYKSNKVIFVGGVYEKNILEAIRYYAKAYFHGHSVGGTNPSLLEALGCGNIILAHDNIFNREVIGAIGFYFKLPSEISKLISTIESLSANEKKDLSTQARVKIVSDYNWEKVTDAYFSFLK